MKVVPWSGEERAGEITKMYAMSRRFGIPSGFLTVAPDDVHQVKSIRLSYRAGRPDAFPSCADTLLPVLRGEASPVEYEAFCIESLAAAPDALAQKKRRNHDLDRTSADGPCPGCGSLPRSISRWRRSTGGVGAARLAATPSSGARERSR